MGINKRAKQFKRYLHTHKFFRFLLIDRIKNKKDNIVLVTGKRGSGKTTLALKIILGFSNIDENREYYNKEKNENAKEKKEYDLQEFTPFDMEKHMCFSKKELQTLWKEERNSFILADEAVVNASRRNSMTRANKILMEIATINRKNFNTVFFCIPGIEDFDIAMLQYVSHWLHIDDRGLGVVLLPNPPSLFGRTSWDIPAMKKIHEKFLEKNPTAPGVPYWLFDNFRGYINFHGMPKKVEELYNKIAHEKKNKDSDELEFAENKISKWKLDNDKQLKINEIVKQMVDGEIVTSQDYYAKAGGLEISKDKFNKEINKELFKLGIGTFSQVLKNNKNNLVQEESFPELV